MAVYFIQNIDTGYIKIGKSFVVNDRLKALIKQERASLRLLGVIKGYSAEETDLHVHFDEIRLHGEWFENNTDLIEFIKTHSVSLEDLDEISPTPSVVIKSNIKDLACNINIDNAHKFSLHLRVSGPTAKQLWNGNISKTRLSTLLKVAALFHCKIDDLFEVS